MQGQKYKKSIANKKQLKKTLYKQKVCTFANKMMKWTAGETKAS